ncbi:MAG TPA: hypothetical protein VD907_03245 [Verrucomicrobiae bacterium]|nr:hypothetical protein [Verrucomicrobiae bacterium]
MKKRHIILINIIFFGLMAFSASTVYEFMTGSSPLHSFAQLLARPASTTAITTDACSTKPANNKLHGASLPQLKKLASYQEVCRSFVTDTLMVFFSMPKNQTEAISYAKQDAKILKEFSRFGIRPLVIAEPTDAQGVNIDFGLFANGSLDAAIKAYFTELKAQGLKDNQLGIWNPFPEANLPYWKNNRPEYFAPAVNRYLSSAREQFPGLQTSILLNSATYEMTDFNWESGDYNSLLPYVGGITPGLVTYAGIQGFPWVSRQGGNGVIFNAAEFLNPPLLTEMADIVGTKKVWFNTGTFSTKYTLDPESIRTIEPARRKEILLTIRAQAELVKQQGYEVAINIFAQDKSEETEETNWSYWSPQPPTSSLHTPVFTHFTRELADKRISLWLFDA